MDLLTRKYMTKRLLTVALLALQIPIAVAVAADPEFGPWYGHAPLPAAKGGRNRLPAGSADDKTQDWPYLAHWQVHGPAAMADWRGPRPGLPVALPGAAGLDPNTWRAAEPEAATGFVYLAGLHP